MQDKYTTYIRKRTVRQIAFLAAVTVAAMVIGVVYAGSLRAEAEARTITAWILCQPNDYVNARQAPGTRSECVGRLECGDVFEIDGREKNGFFHAPDFPSENGEAWVYSGYIALEKPENADGKICTIRSSGRVACRKWIEGPRRCWVIDGSEVRVYSYTRNWAVTNKGFIQTQYIEGLGE